MPIFKDEEQVRLREAVQKFEAQTSVELVLATSPNSGRYPVPSWLLAFTCGFLALSVYIWAPVTFYDDLAYLAIVTCAGLGYLFGHYIKPYQRLLTPKKIFAEQVELQAYYTFAKQGLHHTKAETGLLVYVSDFERMAYLVADRGVKQAAGEALLDEFKEKIQAMYKEGQPVDYLIAQLEAFAPRFGEVLPPCEENNEDELDNVFLKDGVSHYLYRGFGFKRFKYRVKKS